MKILAIETATEACSAALMIDGVCEERYRLAPREHNLLILPMIESLLAEAELAVTNLDAIAFGCGPGSFTGVRVATGVTQGIALGAGLPVIPVSTLAALAEDALEGQTSGCAYPCIDARMSEVYWGVYCRTPEGGLELSGAEAVLPPSDIPVTEGCQGTGTGSGWMTYEAILTARLGNRLNGILPDRFPRAAAIARLAVRDHALGRLVLPEEALPVYLRNDVAKKSTKTGPLRSAGELS